MGMITRFVNIVRANLNSMLNKAEDPSKLLEQTINDMQGAYQKAKEQVARSVADQKRIEESYRKEEEKAKHWHERAILAVEKQDDALAKEALKRKTQHTQLATQYTSELSRHTQNVENLKTNLKDLELKITEIKNKKNLLISKQKRAEAQDQIHKTLSGINNMGGLDTIERMEEKIEEMGHMADARASLNDEFSGDSLESQFEKLGSKDVDTELLELKQQLRIEK